METTVAKPAMNLNSYTSESSLEVKGGAYPTLIL